MKEPNSQLYNNEDYLLLSPLLREVDLLGDSKRPYLILEPCCGEGGLSEALIAEGHHVASSDLDTNLSYPNFYHDATLPYQFPKAYRAWERPDWVITNPPYNQPNCQQILEMAYNQATVGVAFLLRLTYLEPCKNRSDFLSEAWLSHLLVFNPRPRHRVDTNNCDTATVAWFVWQKRKAATSIVYCNDWRKQSK